MTTSYNGGANYPNDDYGTGDYGTGDYSADAFDVNASHGALRHHGTTLVDGTYGDGQQLHPINDPATNGWVHRRGTGKMNAVEAWGFGFKATFANWQVWITYGLLATVGIFALSYVVPVVGNLLSFAMLFVYPVIYSFALMSTLAKHWKFNGLNAPRYGLSLGVLVVISLIAMLIGVIVLFIALAVFGQSIMDTAGTLDQAALESGDIEEMMPLILSMMKVIGLTGLIMFFLAPFFVFPVWYAADNAADFGGSLKEGLSAGARNYGQLLLFSLIGVVVTVVGALLFGLGLVVVVPASTLAQAYAYRQVSGGPVPAEA